MLTLAQLGKYQYMNEFEKQTGVSKVYVVLGLAALYFFLIFFNIGAEFLVNTIGFVLPAYYSLNALFTSGSADDTQWLTVSRG
jgi:receptor expression-enhancing protein 5/6